MDVQGHADTPHDDAATESDDQRCDDGHHGVSDSCRVQDTCGQNDGAQDEKNECLAHVQSLRCIPTGPSAPQLIQLKKVPANTLPSPLNNRKTQGISNIIGYRRRWITSSSPS